MYHRMLSKRFVHDAVCTHFQNCICKRKSLLISFLNIGHFIRLQCVNTEFWCVDPSGVETGNGSITWLVLPWRLASPSHQQLYLTKFDKLFILFHEEESKVHAPQYWPVQTVTEDSPQKDQQCGNYLHAMTSLLRTRRWFTATSLPKPHSS